MYLNSISFSDVDRMLNLPFSRFSVLYMLLIEIINI